MPLLYVRQVSNTKNLALWQITETLDDLYRMYGNNVESLLSEQGINHKSKKAEWIVQRLILTAHLGPDYTLKKRENGAPYLINSNKQGPGVSISHTKGYVAMLFSETAWAGVDMEHIDGRAQRIAHKFLSNIEQKEYLRKDDHMSTLLWSLKETAFKTYNQDSIIFKEDIIINEVHENRASLTLPKLNRNAQEIEMEFETIDDHVLVYLVNP